MKNLAAVYQLSAALLGYHTHIFQGEAPEGPNLTFFSVRLGIFLIQFRHSQLKWGKKLKSVKKPLSCCHPTVSLSPVKFHRLGSALIQMACELVMSKPMQKEHICHQVFFPGSKMFTVKMLLEIVIKQCMTVFHMHQKDLLLLQTLLDVSE